MPIFKWETEPVPVPTTAFETLYLNENRFGQRKIVPMQQSIDGRVFATMDFAHDIFLMVRFAQCPKCGDVYYALARRQMPPLELHSTFKRR